MELKIQDPPPMATMDSSKASHTSNKVATIAITLNHRSSRAINRIPSSMAVCPQFRDSQSKAHNKLQLAHQTTITIIMGTSKVHQV